MEAMTVRMSLCILLVLGAAARLGCGNEPTPPRAGVVQCANLIYGQNQTSRCYADHFLADAQKETSIWTDAQFVQVAAESADLYLHPFAVMSGDSAFTFTQAQATNLRRYLLGGGFLVVSVGCSSPAFAQSFESQVFRIMPEPQGTLVELPADHPVFHTVYDIDEIKTKKPGVPAVLKALIIDGRVALVYSPHGLNDTANAGGKCCCCGGNEVLNARQLNVNLLAYALTH
jgi:hypothetical protein